MGALHLGEIKVANLLFDMTAIHRPIGDQRLVTDRQIVDGVTSELVEFQFFLVEWGKEVMSESVTDIGHDQTCPSTHFPESWVMSVSFCILEVAGMKSGPCRDRTDDPRIKSPLLYRLS